MNESLDQPADLEELCPGVYFAEGDIEAVLETGRYLTIEDFHNACTQTNQKPGEGTYIFSRLALTLAEHHPEAWKYLHQEALNPYKTKTGLRNQILLSTQVVRDMWLERNRHGGSLYGIGKKGELILRLTVDSEAEIEYDPSSMLNVTDFSVFVAEYYEAREEWASSRAVQVFRSLSTNPDIAFVDSDLRRIWKDSLTNFLAAVNRNQTLFRLTAARMHGFGAGTLKLLNTYLDSLEERDLQR